MQYIIYASLLSVAGWFVVEIVTHVLDEFRFKKENK